MLSRSDKPLHWMIGTLSTRVPDRETRLDWRIVYRIDSDAILVIHWFDKKTRATPRQVIDLCQRRLERYERG